MRRQRVVERHGGGGGDQWLKTLQKQRSLNQMQLLDRQVAKQQEQ
jgi:hypothetical protein